MVQSFIKIEKDIKTSAVNVCRRYYKKGRLSVECLPDFGETIIIIVGSRRIKSLPLIKLTLELGISEAWKFLKENGGRHSITKRKEFFQPIAFSSLYDDLFNCGYFE